MDCFTWNHGATDYLYMIGSYLYMTIPIFFYLMVGYSIKCGKSLILSPLYAFILRDSYDSEI